MTKALMMALVFQTGSLAPVELTKIPTQDTMVLYEPGGRPVQSVLCHKSMAKPLTAALTCMKERHPDLLPMTYHGCYNLRTKRLKHEASSHAYGTAIDLNVHIGVPERMASCFEEAGFVWGGRWKGRFKDDMHFELR